MADTDTLKQYNVGNPPTLPNSDKLYYAEELRKVQLCIGLLIGVMKKLEARMTAHGV
uniref:Uncharacterized protein n=1 Tax=Rhodopseudomonas palustris (strain DX-1) TaxID=652103 RepID=E6VL31_RHOPX